MNSKHEQTNLKDECYTEGQELSNDNEKLVNEKDNEFKWKLKFSVAKYVKMEEVKKELEAKAERSRMKLNAQEENAKQLDEQVLIFKRHY